MKILFISNFYPPNVFGGYEKLCFEVAFALQERGHEVTVLTSFYGIKSNECYNHVVLRKLFLFATEGNIYKPYQFSPSDSENQKENCKCFNDTLSEVLPDVIFVWNLHFFSSDLLNIIEQSKVPKCYLLTDNWLIAQINSSFISSYFSRKVFDKSTKKNVVKDIYKWIVKKFYRKSYILTGHAIFPSKFMCHLYQNAGFKFLKKQSICYHGVKFIHSSECERQARYNLCNNSEVKLLFAGRIVDIKGTHIAIESLRIVQDNLKRSGQNLHVSLTIVGDLQDQSYFEKLKLIIKNNKLNDSVVFQKPVDEKDLFKLFQTHDIYIFPSLYEPFSLTLIFALEAGIPTIASNIGGNLEIIQDRKTGLFFRAGDPRSLAKKICLLSIDKQLRHNISQAASTHASSFTFDNFILKIEKELQTVSL